MNTDQNKPLSENRTDENGDSGTAGGPNLFSTDRFYGRMCGFAVSVLQKRDPEHYSKEKLQDKDDTYLLIMVLTVLNDEEREVYDRLIDLRKELSSNGSYAESVLGIVEGARVVKQGLDVNLLTQKVNILDEQPQQFYEADDDNVPDKGQSIKVP